MDNKEEFGYDSKFVINNDINLTQFQNNNNNEQGANDNNFSFGQYYQNNNDNFNNISFKQQKNKTNITTQLKKSKNQIYQQKLEDNKKKNTKSQNVINSRNIDNNRITVEQLCNNLANQPIDEKSTTSCLQNINNHRSYYILMLVLLTLFTVVPIALFRSNNSDSVNITLGSLLTIIPVAILYCMCKKCISHYQAQTSEYKDKLSLNTYIREHFIKDIESANYYKNANDIAYTVQHLVKIQNDIVAKDCFIRLDKAHAHYTQNINSQMKKIIQCIYDSSNNKPNKAYMPKYIQQQAQQGKKIHPTNQTIINFNKGMSFDK